MGLGFVRVWMLGVAPDCVTHPGCVETQHGDSHLLPVHARRHDEGVVSKFVQERPSLRRPDAVWLDVSQASVSDLIGSWI